MKILRDKVIYNRKNAFYYTKKPASVDTTELHNSGTHNWFAKHSYVGFFY